MVTTSLKAQQWNFNEVDYTPQKTTFRLFAPPKAKVSVLYSKDAQNSNGGKWVTVKMKPGTDGIYCAVVEKDLKNHAYRFSVNGQLSVGVFAKAVSVNGETGKVVDLSETNPAGWESDRRPVVKSPADLIIYEMHHRDFSVDASSGLVNKGKFLALTEPKAIRHLKELGVNAIHILPSYDYGSVDETRLEDNKYNWGYDPVNYNVPEGGYSTDPYNPLSRIREFKQMVQALHQAGIRVILDVVYNHTYDIDHSNFQKTYPDYYYRKNADGTYSNGSGCGNETASEQPMMRRFMIESVKYWINEYHIDGFRFDLMGCHDVPTMNLIRASLDELYPDGSGKQILMYGEPWTGVDAAISNGCTQDNARAWGMSDRIGLFCDWLRDSIKGNPDDDLPGWVQGSNDRLTRDKGVVIVETNENDNRLRGGLNADDGRLNVPSQTVTYCDAHDNLILWDKLLKSQGSTEWNTYSGAAAETYLKQLRLAETYLMVSQGMQFQVAGTEFARSKQGDHNSYNAPDDINAIDWTARKTNKAGSDFYKGLISIRFSFSPITDPVNPYKGRYENWLSDDPGLIAFWIDNTAEGEWSKLVVILNNSDQSRSVSLPAGSWTVVSNGIAAGTNSLGTATGSYTVEGFGSAILCQGYQPTSGFTAPLLLSATLILNFMNNR